MSARLISAALLLAALVAGTLSDGPPARRPITIAGYRVLQADFHVHNFPLSAATLAPWDLVLEARRQNLDALAITAHSQVLAGKLGRWFSRLIGGPTVLVGEEIHAPRYHVIAVGIHTAVSWRLRAADAIDEIHRQGGFAIAAHPVAEAWPGFDAAAMSKLDGAEVLQPIAYAGPQATRELREFFARVPLTAVGSSDYHGNGPLGICRTYVFARENTEAGILEALRARRTVVMDRGQAFGDPEMLRLGTAADAFDPPPPPPSTTRFLILFSRTCALAGLAGLALSSFRD